MGALISSFTFCRDAMNAPLRETGVRERIEGIRPKPLAPALGLADEHRQLDGAILAALLGQDGEPNRIARKQFNHERGRMAGLPLVRDPVLNIMLDLSH